MIKNMRKGPFDNFDPDMSTYDPRRRNNADGNGGTGAAGYTVQAAKPGNKMQVNLQFNNASASDLTFEAWNFLDSFMNRRKAEYVVAAFGYWPQLSYEGIQRVAADTGGTVGFDSNGSCSIKGANLAAAAGTLSCKEICYKGFFEASAATPFEVAYSRYKSSNDPQIDEPIVYIQKSYSGGVMENPIDVRSYQKPTNQIETLIDITVGFTIGIDKGVRMKVLAGQYVKWSLFIVGWTNQTLGA